MYLVNTRLDICYVVNALSQFMCKPKEIHLMRYLQGTLNLGLKYEKVELDLHGYANSDWVGSVTNRKSTSGCCFNLGSAMISWICRKQSLVAKSSTEVEYIAAAMASREAIWLRKLLVELFGQAMNPTIIHCDNHSFIKIFVNPIFHDRSKHIEIPYHYVRDMVDRNANKLEYICTADQTVDILTKPLSLMKIDHFKKRLDG